MNNKVLEPNPSFVAKNWAGYEHFTDATVMDFNKLTYPSRNCSIPSFDKIVPDLGKTLIGQVFDENAGITGNKQKFKNLGGIEQEVRVYPSLDANLKDVIETYFDNTRLVFTVSTGSFAVNDIISGATSGATATITDKVGTTLFLRKNNNLNFTVGETISNSAVTATGVVVKAPTNFFLQITQNVNPIPVGPHEFYFDSWFDSVLNNSSAPAIPGKNLNRLVWVNGYQDPSTKQGAVYSWTGGLAVITSIVANTSISINPATTWRSLGFSEDALGNVTVIVNGLPHAVAVPADLDTSTINIASTAGITIGDFATSAIETDVVAQPFDMCRANKGYMFYGNWRFPKEFQSNAYNRNSFTGVTSFQAVQNDLVLDSSAYTGTGSHVYKVTITAVNPDVNIQTFNATGPNGLNDGRYVTSGYSATGNNLNVYKILVVGDLTLALDNGTIVGTFVIGETVSGVNGSGNPYATGQIVKIFPAIQPGIDVLVIRTISGSFDVNDIITGNSSGATSSLAGNGVSGQDWIQYYKNDVLTTLTVGTITGTLVPIPVSLTTTLTDGLIINWGNYFGHVVGDAFELDIRQGGADTFQWQIDNATPTTGVVITGANQTLSNGVVIKFVKKTGHTIGDFWDITVIQAITRAWVNFYYTLPVRRPGEGYVYNLPSNFWTMDTQEESMYVNGSYGEWGFISTQLSADLLSESVSYTPLKQAGANKVLYPYLTGHLNDDLIFIDTEHNLDTIGRKQLLEKPQTGYLSDPVKLDFDESSFIGGRIKYFNKRLYVSSPNENITHVFDTKKDYWQPPKDFAEVGILSIIGNRLVAHSPSANQSFTMFTNNAGDNGAEYTVEMRTATTPVSERWQNKVSSMSFTEGYIKGDPKLVHTAYLEVNGCGGTPNHVVSPIICLGKGSASFGEGSFGSHAFGSDSFEQNSYFQEIYKDYGPENLSYYFISLGITCSAKSHTYKILSLGMNGMFSLSGNTNLLNQESNS